MKRIVACLCTFVVLTAAGILLSASLLTVSTGTWTATGAMSTVRSGAASVVLQDGRILVTGGNDANGPTSSAELFSANGSFSLAAPMSVPRTGHIAVVLLDGRVLVAGGT